MQPYDHTSMLCISRCTVLRPHSFASFRCVCCTGGEAEAQAAYDEAVNAVFNLQLECHRHAQPHKSKKDGKTKWAMIEMWPIIVSLLAAVLACVLPDNPPTW